MEKQTTDIYKRFNKQSPSDRIQSPKYSLGLYEERMSQLEKDFEPKKIKSPKNTKIISGLRMEVTNLKKKVDKLIPQKKIKSPKQHDKFYSARSS